MDNKTLKQDFIKINVECNPHYYCEKQILYDLKTIILLKKILHEYQHKSSIDENLLLNQIIIINNIFPENVLTIIFDRMFSDFDRSIIKSVLSFLNIHNHLHNITPNRNISDILLDSDKRNKLFARIKNNMEIHLEDLSGI